MRRDPSLLPADTGFTMIELMVSLVIGMLLVVAAMMLYVPVSRSLLDQIAIAQQTHSQGVGYDFNIVNLAGAGFGVPNPAMNTDLVLVQDQNGTGLANNVQIPIPTTGSASGSGVFWQWQNPATGAVSCAGIEIQPSGTGINDAKLLYYGEAAGGSCTGNYWASATNWNTIGIIPDIAVGTTPITVTVGQRCETRDAILVQPVLHPQVKFNFSIASQLNTGFFQHATGNTWYTVPATVCLTNF